MSESRDNMEHQLNKKDIESLQESLKDLKGFVKDGFDGIHKRQDTTNGNVKKNTQYRIGLTWAIAVLWATTVPLAVATIKLLIDLKLVQ